MVKRTLNDAEFARLSEGVFEYVREECKNRRQGTLVELEAVRRIVESIKRRNSTTKKRVFPQILLSTLFVLLVGRQLLLTRSMLNTAPIVARE